MYGGWGRGAWQLQVGALSSRACQTGVRNVSMLTWPHVNSTRLQLSRRQPLSLAPSTSMLAICLLCFSFRLVWASREKFAKVYEACSKALSLSLSLTYCLQLDFIRLPNLCSLANAGNKQWQQHSGNYLAKSAVNATWADSDLQHTLLFLTHSLTHWLPLVQFPFQFQFQLLVSGLLCVLRSQWGI